MKFNGFKIFFISFLLFAVYFTIYGEGDKKGDNRLNKQTAIQKSLMQGTGKVGDSYRLNINNISLPMNRIGVIAEVDYDDNGNGSIEPSLGEGSEAGFGGHHFLFSSGFFLSGFSNGTLFANGVASASLVKDYVQGTISGGASDPRAQMYVVKAGDAPFSKSWTDWIDAVALGADFYDGDGDGMYNPVDKNGNGLWDPDEDMPDLVGDETVWCVYNDGLPQNQRRWNTVSPLGIEVRQTVFAFAAKGAIGNLIFVRYRIKYVGKGSPNEPDQLDNSYFGVWADPDLGDYTDDLVGSDTIRNCGYVYNNDFDGPDNDGYGANPPSFFIDFFSGPKAYIAGETYIDNNGNNVYDEGVDTPLDTAFSERGQIKGVQEYPGAKNLGISSFVQYINGDAVINDPNTATEARYYMLGIPRTGTPLDPCNWTYSTVFPPTNCADVDKRFWYSGDPVTNTGWVCTTRSDTRMMQNTGPFILKKNEETEVVVAYVVGQGNNPLNSVVVARQIDEGAQTIFDNNFSAPAPPPVPKVQVSTSDNFIDLLWSTNEQIPFKDDIYNDYFQGFNVYAYQTNSTTPFINNQPNKKLIANYQIKNFIKDLYLENGNTGGIELLYAAADSSNLLDSSVFVDPNHGRVRLRITQDPFTGEDLVKGKPYFFSVTSYAVNYSSLINKDVDSLPVGTPGNYYLTSSGFVQTVENIETIINYNNKSGIYVGEDVYNPPVEVGSGSHLPGGGSNGQLTYDIVSKNDLTGNKYKVTFFQDKSTTKYSAFWKLQNVTSNSVLLDSAKYYLFNNPAISQTPTDGFIVKLSQEAPVLGTIQFNTNNEWYDTSKTRFYYLKEDLTTPTTTKLNNIGSQLSTKQTSYISADKIRRVEIIFGENQKAYRYMNGFVGAAAPLRRQSYVYGEAVNTNNPNVTVDLSSVGKLGEGFVDVPFQVWEEDSAFGERRQLTVGFLERSVAEGGNPDGIWDPGTNVDGTGEYIFIFDETYDPNGNQQVYKGNFTASTQVWADLKGYVIPDDASATNDQRLIAQSSYFDLLYAVGVQKNDNATFYSPGDKFILPVSNYPYTSQDVYEFETRFQGVLTQDEEKDLFKKVNVFPNPLYGYNIATSYTGSPADEPFVTFSNLPTDISIKIYSLSGQLLKTLGTADKSSPTSPFLNWNLQNEAGLRVASGIYIAIVSSPKYGDKILKFSIIMPQKQIQRY